MHVAANFTTQLGYMPVVFLQPVVTYAKRQKNTGAWKVNIIAQE